MELIELVSELLYTHNCVIIPGFGGFVGNFKSTEFDEKRMLLSPARKKVAFNRSLQENDGLLINALMKRKNISYDKSEKEVELFVSFMNDRLEKYRNYEFRNIGSFYLNKEEKLIFVAYEGLNFFKKSYGLQDVKVRQLQGVEQQAETAQQSVAQEEVKIVPLKTPKRRYYIPQLAASVVILAACGFFLWQFLNQSGSTNRPIADVSQEDSPAQTASVVPDFSNDDEIIQNESPEITEVTDELIERGELKDVINDAVDNLHPEEAELIEEQPQDNITPVIEETPQPRQVEIPRFRRFTDKSIPQWHPVIGRSTQEIEEQSASSADAEQYEEVVRQDEVPQTEQTQQQRYEPETEIDESVIEPNAYYIAIAVLKSEADADNYLQRLNQLNYSSITRLDQNGKLHMCIERFSDKKNAGNYLNLVRRYDYPKAYLIELQE